MGTPLLGGGGLQLIFDHPLPVVTRRAVGAEGTALVGGSAPTVWAEEAEGVDGDEAGDEGSALPLALAPVLAEAPAGPGGDVEGVVDSENGARAVAGVGKVELAFLTGPPEARNDARSTIVMAPAVPATSSRDRRPGRGDSPTSHCHHCLSTPTQFDIGRLPMDPGLFTT